MTHFISPSTTCHAYELAKPVNGNKAVLLPLQDTDQADSCSAHQASGDLVEEQGLFGADKHFGQGDPLLLASTHTTDHLVSHWSVCADLPNN